MTSQIGWDLHSVTQREAVFVLKELCWGRARVCRRCSASKTLSPGLWLRCFASIRSACSKYWNKELWCGESSWEAASGIGSKFRDGNTDIGQDTRDRLLTGVIQPDLSCCSAGPHLLHLWYLWNNTHREGQSSKAAAAAYVSVGYWSTERFACRK